MFKTVVQTRLKKHKKMIYFKNDEIEMKSLMRFEPSCNGKIMDSSIGRVAACIKLAATLPTELSIVLTNSF